MYPNTGFGASTLIFTGHAIKKDKVKKFSQKSEKSGCPSCRSNNNSH